MIPGVGIETRPSFGSRQFAAESTPAQRIFDVVFGVVVPLALVELDPIVFRSWGDSFDPSPRRLPTELAIFALVLLPICMTGLIVWLATRRSPTLHAGILVAGTLFSSLTALVCLPLAMIGWLVTPLALLGFLTPLTALVYLRNTVRAARQAVARGSSRRVFLGAASVCVMVIGAAVLGDTRVRDARRDGLDVVVSGIPEEEVSASTKLLARFGTRSDLGRLVEVHSAGDRASQTRIESAIRAMTGRSPEDVVGDYAD